MSGIDQKQNDGDDYKERSTQFGLASKEAVLEKAKKEIFLDVRSFDEVEENKLEGFNVVHIPCTRKDTSKVVEEAQSLLPDKNGPLLLVPFFILCAIS